MSDEAEKIKELRIHLHKTIRSRYVRAILDKFEFTHDELLWFKATFPRIRKSNPCKKKTEDEEYINQGEFEECIP